VRAIGKLSTFLVLAAAAVGAVVAVKSIPDMKRYAEMRKM
jgi:formate hydrogenlyase subunit 3/multisubunit Na+/H+ antiporter MnhD subunit